MFDFNSLPIPGGVFVAGITWATLSAFVLGPVVADRTIDNTGWHKICERDLRASAVSQIPKAQSKPDIRCKDIANIFGPDATQLCELGGNTLFDIITIDPLAAQKEQARQLEADRLSRITALAPSACSCAASSVSADRLSWGLFAGSARLIGGPKYLQADLTQALHAPACARLGVSSGKDKQ